MVATQYIVFSMLYRIDVNNLKNNKIYSNDWEVMSIYLKYNLIVSSYHLISNAALFNALACKFPEKLTINSFAN